MSFKKSVLTLTLVSLIVGLVTAMPDSAEARRRRRRHRSRVKRAVINEPVLYERMGGSKMVSTLVDEWVRSALADGRLSGAFGNVQAKPDIILGLRKSLNQQLCELADGPCTAKADGKKSVDVMAMADDNFVIFADHLSQTMDKNKVREREKNEMLGRIGEARGESGADDSEDTAAE